MSARVPGPATTAGALALAYAVVCCLYIWASDELVSRAARDVEQLERWQLAKGLGFVLATSGVLFVLSYLLLRNLVRQEAELRDSRSALLASERRAIAGIFAASVAHDINNILTVLQVEMDRRPASGDAASARVSHAMADLRLLARQLMAAGREGMPGRLESCDVVGVVRTTLDFVRKHRSVRHTTTVLEAECPVPMTINAAMVEHMTMNLVLNAAEATGGAGRVLVRVARADGGARIEVHDDGPGIPADDAARIFDPFYTSKPDGSGLGLLSVKSCAEAHRGTVQVDRSPLGGARFTVTLPAPEHAGAVS